MIKIPGIVTGLLTLLIGINSASAATINVDASNYYQQIVGFGTSSVGWVRAVDDYYETPAFLNQYVDEMGMSIYRMPIRYEVLTTPVANASDIKYTSFSITSDRVKSYINQADRIHQRDPSIKLIMTSWSPPAWMKTNNDTQNGGYLKRTHFEHFAYYILAWCDYMTKVKGIRPYAVSFQNELLYSQPTFESCVWTVDEYVDFVKILGPLLDSNGYEDVLMFGPEHMTTAVAQTMDFVDGVMSDPEAAPYFDVIATHGYTNGVQADTNPASASALFNRWRKYPLQYWMTETSGEAATFNGALDGVAASIHNSLVGGRSSAYVYWQFAEVSPAGSGGTEYCLRSINPSDTPSKKYWAFRHFSRWIRPDSWRVDAVATAGTKLDVSSFVHEGNQEITIVLLNRHVDSQSITINFEHTPGLTSLNGFRTNSANESTTSITAIPVNNGQAQFTLPARSLLTLVGKLDGYVRPEYTTDFTPITIPAGSGELSIPITTTDETGTWRVENNVDWLTSETPKGQGNTDAVVKVSRNTTGIARTGTIEISSRLLTIIQEGNPGLTFAGYGTTIPFSGGTSEVTIDVYGTGRNRDWTATSSADWLVLTSASGRGAGTISYTVSKNNGSEPRTATITLEEQVYTVTQEAGNGSIFPEIGWMASIGFYYDGFYPFVYLWATGEWIYIPDGYGFDAFFFWRFAAEHWGFTAGEWLPFYIPFTETGTGDTIDITVPVE